MAIVTHGPRDAPAVALTFDDGPGSVTPAILDVLGRRGAQATFDVLGARVRAGAALVRRAAAEGHELGVHGWRHRDLSRQPVRALAELARAAAAIRGVTGVTPRVFRPPFGAASRPLAAAARMLGLVTVTWDVDPRDFEEPGADAIRARVRAGVRPGSIVLLHDDRPGLAATAAALDGILDDLAARGLAALTVSRLLARRASALGSGQAMPTPPICPSCGQPASEALAGPEHGWECRNEACPEFGQAVQADEPPAVTPPPASAPRAPRAPR